jgi:UDP-N-acetylmuramoylalanine-D-glutamate ligase
MDPETQEERSDLDHELHLKVASIVTEVNDVKNYVNQARKLEAGDEGFLLPESISNFDHYSSYMERICSCED